MGFLHGVFAEVSPALGILFTLIGFLALGFIGTPMLVWTVFLAAVLWFFGAPVWLLAVAALVAVVMNVTPIRRALVTNSMKGY